MDLLTELNERIAEIENRIVVLVQHLERQRPLEEALDRAGQGLGKASTNIGKLADSTRASTEYLKNVLVAFREVVEALQRSDPARTLEAVSKVETELVRADQEMRKVISDAVERLSRGQSEVLQRSDPARTLEAVSKVEAELVRTDQETRKAISEAVERLSHGQSEVLQRSDPARTLEAVSKVEAELVRADQETRKVISDAVERLSREQSNEIRGVKRVGYIALVVVLALLVLAVLRSF